MPAAESEMPVFKEELVGDDNNNVLELASSMATLSISEPFPLTSYVQYYTIPYYLTDPVQVTVGSPIPASTPTTDVTSPSTGLNPTTYKYKIPSGTKIEGRIFVGGVTAGTSEQELKGYFGAYGSVKDVKIIFDKQGLTKGYAFVTFTSNEEATKLIKQADAGQLFLFKEKKLNIGPAIKKRPNYAPPADFVVPGAGGMIYPGYTYQNGVAYFTPEGVPQAPPFPGHQALLAMPYHVQPQQPYPTYNTAAAGQQWGGQQWRWAGQSPAVTQAPPTYGSPTTYGVEYAYPSPPYPADMGVMEATPAPEMAPIMPAFDPAMQANVTYSVQTPVPAVDYTRTAAISWTRKPGTPRRYTKPLISRRPSIPPASGVAMMVDSKDEGDDSMTMSAIPADE